MVSHFGPVGSCIYCGTNCYDPEYVYKRLTDEHVIPAAIGGDMILDCASCLSCQRKTAALETQVFQKMLKILRYGTGLTGRKRPGKFTPSHLPLIEKSYKGNTEKQIPLDQHPTPGLFPVFDLPDMLLPEISSQNSLKHVEVIKRDTGVNPNVGGAETYVESYIDIESFVRVLAKIGLSISVAQFGQENIVPYVRQLILGDMTRWARLVGCVPGFFDKSENHSSRHSFHILKKDGYNLIIQRIQLFSHCGNPGTPHYLVVVGHLRTRSIVLHPENLPSTGVIGFDKPYIVQDSLDRLLHEMTIKRS